MAHGPLISDFVEQANHVLLAGDAGWALRHFQQERRARTKLQSAYAKANVNIDNIEDLFDAYETASLLKRLSDLNQQDVELLPRDLRFVIMRTIERAITFPIKSPVGVVGAPPPYAGFVDLVRQIQEDSKLAPVAVISFNYDLCLDYALA